MVTATSWVEFVFLYTLVGPNYGYLRSTRIGRPILLVQFTNIAVVLYEYISNPLVKMSIKVNKFDLYVIC